MIQKNLTVMAGLVPAIHVLVHAEKKDVDARDKRGHDDRKIKFVHGVWKF